MRYLVIGHVCKDLTPDGWTFGGTATYAARTAQAVGCSVHVVTSTGADIDVRTALPDVDVINSPAENTTTFENIYTPDGRVQMLHGVANRLDTRLAKLIAKPPVSIDVVHLAPVAQEVDRTWLDLFRSSFIGITPQGWLRQWDQGGRVNAADWTAAEAVLRRSTAVVLSIEDVRGDEFLVKQWAKWARVLVVTRGAQGCSVYYDGVITDLPAIKVEVVDETGAGDVFAAAFFVRLKQTASPVAAARFANCMAGKSITRPGLQGVPNTAEIQQCLQTSPLTEAKYPLNAASR
jgi:sugar/nucleoside kinase (ribokinase family)